MQPHNETQSSRFYPNNLSRLQPQFWRFVLFALVALEAFSAGICCQAGENDWFRYLGTKEQKKAPRKQMNAAEALPPLPLPATPLRRTERKKPPQPDCLVGKVIWGLSAFL